MSQERMYTDLAPWWRVLSAPAEYAEEAAFYRRTLQDAVDGGPRAVLELGSGGGNNASHMKRYFQMTLVDLSPGMLDQSREINPDCEHIQGDMRTVRLGREFDGVFVHDAVAYMTTPEDLRRAFETAFVHCRPGGAALFAPDFLRDTFRSSTDCGGSDDGLRGLRYLEWAWDPDPDDTVITVEYAYLLREEDGSVRVIHDRHVEGLFPRQLWLDLLTETGFDAEPISFEHSEVGHTLEVFVARRPPLRP